MDIIIKNVTGEIGNDMLISELSKVGFPEGSIIYSVYSPKRKACFWSSGDNHCVAYLGKTCEKIPRRTRKAVVPKQENQVRYLVINGKIYETPEKIFAELEKVREPKSDFKPTDVQTTNTLILGKLEEIMETCAVKLKLEAVYDTGDFL